MLFIIKQGKRLQDYWPSLVFGNQHEYFLLAETFKHFFGPVNIAKFVTNSSVEVSSHLLGLSYRSLRVNPNNVYYDP
jgi:hypothetical protein